MEFTSEFLNSVSEFEGSVSWMYLDTAGNVTAGVGHLIATPQRAVTLAFQGGDPFHAWEVVKRAIRGKPADYYRHFSTCRLPPQAITSLLQSDLEAAVLQIEAGLHCFPALPEPVQQALCDMAFNLGAAKLLNTYPVMLKCVEASHWDGAAAACHREGIAPTRNDWCAGMFRAALTKPRNSSIEEISLG